MARKNFLRQADRINAVKKLFLTYYKKNIGEVLDFISDSITLLLNNADEKDIENFYYYLLKTDCNLPIRGVISSKWKGSVKYYMLLSVPWHLLSDAQEKASEIMARKVLKEYGETLAIYGEEGKLLDELKELASSYLDRTIYDYYLEVIEEDLQHDLCPSTECGFHEEYFAIPLFVFDDLDIYQSVYDFLNTPEARKYAEKLLEDFVEEVLPKVIERWRSSGSSNFSGKSTTIDDIDIEAFYDDFSEFIDSNEDTLWDIVTEAFTSLDCKAVGEVVDAISDYLRQAFSADEIVDLFYDNFVEYLIGEGYISEGWEEG